MLDFSVLDLRVRKGGKSMQLGRESALYSLPFAMHVGYDMLTAAATSQQRQIGGGAVSSRLWIHSPPLHATACCLLNPPPPFQTTSGASLPLPTPFHATFPRNELRNSSLLR